MMLSASAMPAAVLAQAPDPLTLVDPFVGTSGTKTGGPIDTFPGADAPFGMIQFSPDTPSLPPGGGYDYKDDAIGGFSLDHMSGPGCMIYGDFAILPVTGDAPDPEHARQPFSHKDESASPGYYSVALGKDAEIRAEVTAGARDGIARFAFPRGSDATILVNAASNQGGANDSAIRVVSPTRIEGWASAGQFCGMPNTYTVYFAGEFDRPMSGSGVWGGGHGPHAGLWAHFGTAADSTVTLRVALSWVDQAGAWTNLRSGASAFDAQRAQTAQAWAAYLRRVQITGGTQAQQRTFYTALYHAMLHPNLYSDADGRYRGFDGGVHRVRTTHDEYATFSGWDIYRTQLPLIAMLAPRETSDMMQSLVDDARQGGWLPKWPVANAYSGVMGGDPAAPILAGAYAFGVRGFDTHAALLALIKNASNDASPAGQGWYRPRPGLGEYQKLGYVANTHTTNVSPVPNGASLTLEYAIADFSIAQFARSLHAMQTYRTYLGRSQRWRNLFDTRLGAITPRDRAGAFLQTPITPNGQSGFQEGNAAQYTWMVPHDLATLIYGLGGRAAAIAKLDTYFSQLNAGQDKPYAWLGNEPSLLDPWVYLSAGAPSKAERVISEALDTLYGDTPEGIPGNDDLGTMSAWYVWCALGLYPQNPAAPVLDLGTPLFSSVRINVPGGARIDVSAPSANAQNIYVQGVRVNGADRHATWVAFDARKPLSIAYTLGPAASTWGTATGDAPPSYQATMPSFPPSTSASLELLDPVLAIPPGGHAALRVGVSDPDTANPARVSWRLQTAPQVSAQNVTGAVTANSNFEIALNADSGAPAHYYPATLSAKAENGAILEPRDFSVRVAAADQRIPLAYVANFSDNTITAFDPQTGAVAATISVGTSPGDVAITHGGTQLLTANQGSNDVTVVDTATMHVTATIKTGKTPASLALSPDGTSAWVTDYGDGAVQRIDLQRLSAGRPIPVGRQPQELAFSADGSTLYVADQGDNAVTVLNVRTLAQSVVHVGARPFGIAISKDGSTAYVSDTASNDVTPIDLHTLQARSPIPVGVDPQGMTIAGNRLYVADSGADTISIVDPGRRARIGTIRVGLNPQVVIAADGGESLYTVPMGDNACVKISIAHPADLRTIATGNTPIAVALP
ncbi:MAG TPA: GH92 family glycosyl hydrolase [Candidatus Baltobacteraceae bacterium]|nr:GH92 family glycosyl hydrolase [Candidatus Baltobacteraceae bacterium]